MQDTTDMKSLQRVIKHIWVKSDLLSLFKGKYETKFSDNISKKIKLFAKKI